MYQKYFLIGLSPWIAKTNKYLFSILFIFKSVLIIGQSTLKLLLTQTNYFFYLARCFLKKNICLLFSYTIDDFSSENVVVFSVNVSICFESLEKCEFSIIVLKEARLPKPSCDLEKTFTIPGKISNTIRQIYLQFD